MTQNEAETKPIRPPNKDHTKLSERKERQLTKVIIRRLPPSLDQESFLNLVSPVPNYDYIYSVRGDGSLGENSFARVYINFINPEDVYSFKEKFDNYVFLDNRGHEYPAVVEFAAFQKIPKKRGKVRVDTKCGTIESDPIYLEFLESLKAQPVQDEKPEYSYQLTTENKNDKSTPLLEYIKHKKIEKQRIREEKREERKKRELERKKIRDDERKKHFDERSPVKTVVIKANYSSSKQNVTTEDKDEETTSKKVDVVEENVTEKPMQTSPHYKSKERKYEDKKFVYNKTKYNTSRPEKREYLDKKMDYKNKRDDFKDRDYKTKHYDDYRKESEQKPIVKKVKKYSERREERKIEALKAEQKTHNKTNEVKELKTDKENVASTENHFEFNQEKTDDSHSDENKVTDSKEDDDCRSNREMRGGSKENDPRLQRRIRNKDRPTMALYQPGMLSKRKQVDNEVDGKEPNIQKE